MPSPVRATVVEQLEREWSQLTTGKVARALPCWQQVEPALCPFASPRRLLAFLHSAPAEETDGPLLALLALACWERIMVGRRRRLGVPPREALAGRTVLQVLLPALKTQAERIVCPGRRRDEVWELQLFFAWEAICSYPLARRRRRVAANLALQVLHDTTRGLDHRGERDDDQSELGGGLFPLEQLRDSGELTPHDQPRSRREITPVALAADIVAEGLAAGVIDARDAELILRTRIDGVRLRRLAPAIGASYSALLKRRQRAEAALRNLHISTSDVRKGVPLDLVCSEGTFPFLTDVPDNDRTASDEHAPRAA